jgi:hypothetical protein
MIYTNENMKLFWTTKDNVYNLTKGLTSVVYAFCWANSVPTEHEWPFMLKETFYFGMAGGLKDNYIGDRKAAHRVPVLTTAPHQRMKTHLSKFNDKYGNFGQEKRKYELYHNLFSEDFISERTLCIALLVPKSHVASIGMRNLLSLVESEQIYQYQKMFGQLPALNLAEADNLSDSRKDEKSISQNFVQNLKKQDLTQWMN